jgi:hypothetical protein
LEKKKIYIVSTSRFRRLSISILVGLIDTESVDSDDASTTFPFDGRRNTATSPFVDVGGSRRLTS